jgi:hypothetical protein
VTIVVARPAPSKVTLSGAKSLPGRAFDLPDGRGSWDRRAPRGFFARLSTPSIAIRLAVGQDIGGEKGAFLERSSVRDRQWARAG